MISQFDYGLPSGEAWRSIRTGRFRGQMKVQRLLVILWRSLCLKLDAKNEEFNICSTFMQKTDFNDFKGTK